MANDKQTVVALRKYLSQGKSCGEAFIPEFDEFLKNVARLFTLRMAAEESWSGSPRTTTFESRFLEHRYQAVRLNGALPLEWQDVSKILNPSRDEPARTLVSYIATHCAEDVRIISSGMRRVLSRERVRAPVGNVQQLDAYCMRWLMRRPGRSISEKAGMEQRVMAVVRREQFDTLENRVFKEFLIRSETLATHYLRSIEGEFRGHKVYKSVNDFRLACQWTLTLPELKEVSRLASLPQPNYVLLQDNHYSSIWLAFCKIVQLSNVAEKLWNNRQALAHSLEEVSEECQWQTSHKAFYHTQLWVNPFDGRDDVFERLAPVSHKEASEAVIKERERHADDIRPIDRVGVVDLSGNHLLGGKLIVGGFHANASPRISDRHFPEWDDSADAAGADRQQKRPQEIGLSAILCALTSPSNQDSQNEEFQNAQKHIFEYCNRLLGEYRNVERSLDQLVILAQDDWNAMAQEAIIKAFPMSRSQVHLLWRSIATVLGYEDEIKSFVHKEGDDVAVVDFRNDGSVLVTRLKYLRDRQSERLIPQRSVYRQGAEGNGRYSFHSHSNVTVPAILGCRALQGVSVMCLSGNVPTWFFHGMGEQFFYAECRGCAEMREGIRVGSVSLEGRKVAVLQDVQGFWSQKSGALRFFKEHEKRTLYYDELEAFQIVGQNPIRECVVSHCLVEAEAQFVGGATCTFPIEKGVLNIGEGQRGVEFLVHMGELRENTPLHQYKQQLPVEPMPNLIQLDGEITVSPGQGMAVTKVTSSVFKEPILLDYLKNMTLSDKTIETMNDALPRSFPPITLDVKAYPASDYEMGRPKHWVKDDVQMFLKGQLSFDAIRDDMFSLPSRRGQNNLREGESMLHCLDRINVFGKAVGAKRPLWMTEKEEELLFNKILFCYQQDEDKAIKLMAWTYRAEYKPLEPIVTAIFQTWARGGCCKTVERTLLANMLCQEPYWSLLPRVLDVFSGDGERWLQADDFRVFYNLLQFDGEFAVHAGMTCEKGSKVAKLLYGKLVEYREGVRRTSYKSVLRCILFLLRLRESEHYFLRDSTVPVPSSIDKETQKRMRETFDALDKELACAFDDEMPEVTKLRKAAHEFLLGKGTLPDVVAILEEE